MVVSQQDDIPISELVQAIVDEPLEMARRLDFADRLERHGCSKRACWIRACCSVWEAIYPLSMGLASSGPAISTPLGLVDLSSMVINRTWEKIRPDYWAEIEGVIQSPYFGRFVFTSLADVEGAIQRIGNTGWLPQAHQEGWLESICHTPANAEQIRALVEWPDSHRALPIHVNLTAVWLDGVDNGLLRDLLTVEGLQGLALRPHVFRYSAVKRYGESCRNISFLQLADLTNTATSRGMLEQLVHFTKLRSLLVGHNLPEDSTVSLLTKLSHLQTLRLYSSRVTDSGIRQFADTRSLRMLAVDLAEVSRHAIYNLRESRPDLTVIVEGRLRERLGPV